MLDGIVTRLAATYGGRETEQNWEKVDTLLKEFSGELAKHPPEEIVANVKRCKEVLQDTLGTERTRLALTSLAAVTALATQLATHYEHLQDSFLHPTLRLCERTNRVLSDRAKACLFHVLNQCPLPLKAVMARLLDARTSPNQRLRQAAIEALDVVLRAAPREHLAEHEEPVGRAIREGLQDAAEPVRAASRQLFATFRSLFPNSANTLSASLPPATLKSLNAAGDGASGSAGRPKPSFKAFLATRTTTASSSTATPSEAKAGPQRVAAKPAAVFHPYASTEVSAKKPAPARHALRTSRSATLATPLAERTHAARIAPSASAGSLPRPQPLDMFKSAESTVPAVHIVSIAPPTHLTSVRTTTILEPIVVPPPSARSRVIQFVEAVKSGEWDARYKALVQFTEQMGSPDVADFILGSKSTVTRLFDIFLGGLMDVHFKVVIGVLEYGRRLLAAVPSEKHADAVGFAGMAVLRLYIAMTNIQFRAKQAIIDEARNTVEQLSAWLPGSVAFVEVLASASIRQEASIFSKARSEIVQRIAQILEAGSGSMNESDESASSALLPAAKKLGLLLGDRDESLVQRVCAILQKMSLAIPAHEIVDALPPNCRPILMERFNMAITSSPRPPASSGASNNNNKNKIPDERGSPMHSVVRSGSGEAVATPIAAALPSPHRVDSEVSLNKHIKLVMPFPNTPLSRLRKTNVDFDTPRSMQPVDDDDEPDESTAVDGEEGEEEEGGEGEEGEVLIDMATEPMAEGVTEFVQVSIENLGI